MTNAWQLRQVQTPTVVSIRYICLQTSGEATGGPVDVSAHALGQVDWSKCDALGFGLRPVDHSVCFR